MEKSDQETCQCDKASCACANAKVDRCGCGDDCDCSGVCNCAGSCACADAK